jgi:hypothetical protein
MKWTPNFGSSVNLVNENQEVGGSMGLVVPQPLQLLAEAASVGAKGLSRLLKKWRS